MSIARTTTEQPRKRRAIVRLNPKTALPAICAELQKLQRMRAIYIKSRIMVANRLQAIIAGTIGYHSGMKESDRLKTFTKAGKVIKDVVAGKVASEQHGLILTHQTGIDAFLQMQREHESAMVKLAKQLPVAEWVEQPEQRGLSVGYLAVIIGETGDLSNYAGPAKLWRRLGCAPWSHDGKTLMGATWRGGKCGNLPASEWEAYGYSPRRRSIAYLIGEGMVKQNGGVPGNETDEDSAAEPRETGVSLCETDTFNAPPCGPYRRRYDEAKAAYKAKNPEFSDLRCHRHGMLLATKLLLKNLWIEWNRRSSR